MHSRLATLYSCGCEDCQTKSAQLNLSLSDQFKTLLNTAEKAFKRLHEKGTYKTKDLQTEKAYKDLASQTADIFNFAVASSDMPEVMRNALQNDVYLFSGLKTHAQLFEASRLLLDETGNLKPYGAFANDFNKVNKNYNQTYLNTEYEYAVNAAQMAAKWTEFGDSDRYNLQYRTAGDNRVRDSHAKLNGTTLPKGDPFWDSYYAPNGWNCRCTVVEVLKDKYPLSDSAKAIAEGEKATTQIGKSGKNQLEIFRFNPGKQKVIFPPEHPYNKVVGASKVRQDLTEKQKEELKASRKAKDAEIQQWANSKIKKGRHLTITGKQFKATEVRISKSNIENLLKHTPNVNDKDAIRDIEKIIKSSTFQASKELENKNSKNYGSKVARGVLSYNYYQSKWNGIDVEINMEVMKNGYEQPYAILFNKK